MTPFAIAGIQMNVAAVHENVTGMLHRIDVCMQRFPWVQMVMFSELAAYGPLPSHAGDFAETESKFQEAAAKHGIWLLTGSMFERTESGTYNTASVIDPAGQVVARYRKMFTFEPYEHDIAKGTDFVAFDVPGVGRFGVSICYDIWFPETTRTLTSMGVEVLLHPVLTGTIDRDVELSIARANAAMFQCYVFDINGLMAGGVGRSCVIDPSGTVLYQAAGQEEIIPVEVDLAQVRRQREVGLRNLGQLHKSFRDRAVDFPVYDRTTFDAGYLNSLGPLAMHKRKPAAVPAVGQAANSETPAATPAPARSTGR